MSGRITVGRYNRIDAKATINLPLIDTLFLRASVANLQRDGYVTRTYDGEDLGNVDTQTGRIQLRWKPTSNLEINLNAEGTFFLLMLPMRIAPRSKRVTGRSGPTAGAPQCSARPT